jgi:hypothetical protein
MVVGATVAAGALALAVAFVDFMDLVDLVAFTAFVLVVLALVEVAANEGAATATTDAVERATIAAPRAKRETLVFILFCLSGFSDGMSETCMQRDRDSL